MKKNYTKTIVKTAFTIVILANLVFNATAQIDLNKGLMAWYPFNGNANDSSGNGNNPSFNNATLTTDRFGNAKSAYQFDGKSSYIVIPNSTSLNCGSRASLSMWVKVNGFYNGKCHGNYMLCKGPATNWTLNAVFDDGLYDSKYGKSACSISTPDTLHQTFYSALGGWDDSLFVETNKWYHLVLVSDSNIVSAYLNGQLINSHSKSNVQPFKTSYDLFLGRYFDTSSPYWFNGVLDDIRIFNRAINKLEIDSLNNKTSTTLPLKLKEFTANSITAPFVSLHFATTEELNAASIEIERSYDGVYFTKTGSLNAKGNVGINLYSFVDKTDGVASKIYYRLKLINKDGGFTYSSTATVAVANSLRTFTADVYPNPVRSDLNVNLYAAKDDNLTVRLYDINGKLVYTQKIQSRKGFSTLFIPAFKTLSAGTYTLNITNSNDVVNKKVLKL